jgi:integrase
VVVIEFDLGHLEKPTPFGLIPEAVLERPLRVMLTQVHVDRFGIAGKPIDLHAWRRNHWKPAVEAAGLPYRSPYAMRRTAISLALASGISLFEVSQFTGTSPEVIAKHYGRLRPTRSTGHGSAWGS